jgi:hypothetical protein
MHIQQAVGGRMMTKCAARRGFEIADCGQQQELIPAFYGKKVQKSGPRVMKSPLAGIRQRQAWGVGLSGTALALERA